MVIHWWLVYSSLKKNKAEKKQMKLIKCFLCIYLILFQDLKYPHACYNKVKASALQVPDTTSSFVQLTISDTGSTLTCPFLYKTGSVSHSLIVLPPVASL